LFGLFKLTIVIVRERKLREEDLKGNRGESTYTDAIVRLDTKVHRSQSWLIKPVRMLLVLCSKTCRYLAISYR